MARSATRTPPKSPHWDAPHGKCRWCGRSVYKKGTTTPNMRARWHPQCVTAYMMVAHPRKQRAAVFKRDRGVCAKCGTQHSRIGPWAVDHKHALGLVDRKLPAGDILHYWGLSNLQTLCDQPCHAEKTRLDVQAIHSLKLAALSKDPTDA